MKADYKTFTNSLYGKAQTATFYRPLGFILSDERAAALAKTVSERNCYYARIWLRRRKDELRGGAGMPAVCIGCGGPRDLAGAFYCRNCKRR